jgi:hypothetical protein
MTAIRNFPNAPLRQRTAAPWRWHTPDWLRSAWHTLERFGYRRAAFELELHARHRMASDPDMARRYREAARECRRAASSESTGSAS